MTSGGTTERKSRNRPEVWDEAQVIVWIARRTEKAVVAAAGWLDLVARSNAARLEQGKKPLPIANAVLALDAGKNIYPSGEGEPPSIDALYSDAKSEFKNALARGRLIRRSDGRFDAVEVKEIWPGKGRGNAEKLYLPTADVNALESAIRRNDSATRAGHMKAAGITYTSKKKQKAAYLAAKKSAECNLAVDLPSRALEALKKVGPELPQQAREHLERLAYGRVLDAREREILV
jgi:hypothetical protein